MRRTLDHLLTAPGLTRGRFLALAVVSLLASATVVAAGVRHDRNPWELVAAARGRPAPVVEVTPHAPTPQPAAAAAAETPSPPAASPAATDANSPTTATGGGSVGVPVSTDAPSAPRTPAATPTQPVTAPAKPVSKVKHVFVVDVASAGYDATWGPDSQASYLTGTLRPQGRLLAGYHPLAAGDLATQVALVAGQKPTPGIEKGCPTYGGDCLFPVETLTLPDQLLSKGLRWRGYFDGMTQPCGHPSVDASEDPSSEYTTLHNPFVYFRSLTELGECGSNDVPLDSLTTDLGTEQATPNFVYVAPDRCEGGWSATCADGSAGGLPRTDAFLADWVPKILDSPAYKADGLLIVLFGRQPGPDPADAKTGALLVSQFVTPGTASDAQYDAYGVLRSMEDLFGLDNLGAAGDDSATSFARTELAAGLPG